MKLYHIFFMDKSRKAINANLYRLERGFFNFYLDGWWNFILLASIRESEVSIITEITAP